MATVGSEAVVTGDCSGGAASPVRDAGSETPEERLTTAVGLVTVVEVPASGVGGSTTENGVETAHNSSDSSCGEAAGRDIIAGGG